MQELGEGRRGEKPRAKGWGTARLLFAAGLSGAAIFAPLPQGLANPKGGQVTNGSATIRRTRQRGSRLA